MLDESLDALGDVRRRRLLIALLERGPRNDDPVVPGDVATRGEALERVSVELYHRHLPKLAACGFVDWDRETLEVTRGANFDEIRPLLETLCDRATGPVTG